MTAPPGLLDAVSHLPPFRLDGVGRASLVAQTSPGWLDLHPTGLRYGAVLGWVLMTLFAVRAWPESTPAETPGPAVLELSTGVGLYDEDIWKDAETWWVPPAWSQISDEARAACASGQPLDVDGGSFAVVEVTEDEIRLQGRLLEGAWVGVDSQGVVSVPMLFEQLEPLLRYRKVQAERLPCMEAHSDRVLVAQSEDVPTVALLAVLLSIGDAGGKPDIIGLEPQQLRRLSDGEPLRWQLGDAVRLSHSFEPSEGPHAPSIPASLPVLGSANFVL